MKAQELANYFVKKVGKPILCSIDQMDLGEAFSGDITYSIEPSRCRTKICCTHSSA